MISAFQTVALFLGLKPNTYTPLASSETTLIPEDLPHLLPLFSKNPACPGHLPLWQEWQGLYGLTLLKYTSRLCGHSPLVGHPYWCAQAQFSDMGHISSVQLSLSESLGAPLSYGAL